MNVQFNVNLPDDKLADIVEGMRALYNAPGANGEQIIALIEGDIKTRIRNAYVDYMRKRPYDLDLG